MRARVGTVPSRVLAARSRRARALLCGEAGGAELLVGAVEEVLGGGVDRRGRQRVEAVEQAAVDGGGGLAVELLVDDGLDEGFEGGLGAGEAQGEGAGAGDELGEFGVGGGEFAEGGAES